MEKWVLIVQLQVDETHDEEFNEVYDRDHLPHLLNVEGVLSGQRFQLAREVENTLRYLTVIELASADVFQNDAWQKAAMTPEWMTVRDFIEERRIGLYKTI